jgi:hypothetical protein
LDLSQIQVPHLPDYWQQLNSSTANWRSLVVPGSGGARAMACLNTSGFVITDFDNWLVTQPFQVVAENEYWISFKYRNVLPGTSETLSLYWGNEPIVEELTNPIVHLSDFDATDWIQGEAIMIPETDGYIYLSWHAQTQGGYGMLVDEIMVYDWGLVSTAELEESTIRILSADGDIMIRATEEIKDARISVVNTTGQTIHQERIKNTFQYRRNLNLTPGVYIVSILTDGASINQKVFVR